MKQVYTANYNGDKVIVKSVPYTAELEQTTIDYMNWINFVGEDLSAATYILPGVEHDDNDELLVTVSRFAPGVTAQELGPEAPWSW